MSASVKANISLLMMESTLSIYVSTYSLSSDTDEGSLERESATVHFPAMFSVQFKRLQSHPKILGGNIAVFSGLNM